MPDLVISNVSAAPVQLTDFYVTLPVGSVMTIYRSTADCTRLQNLRDNIIAGKVTLVATDTADEIAVPIPPYPGWASSTPTFSTITAGTNTTALVIGTLGSLTVSGSGTINSTTLLTKTWASPAAIGTGTPAAGTFTALTSTGTTTSGKVIIANGHLVSTQTTAPTTTLTSTTLNDGAGTGATLTVAVGSTDTAGRFTITAGNGTPGTGIAGQIVFDIAFLAAPKSVVLTPMDTGGAAQLLYVSATGTASFQISADVAFASSGAHTYSYQVIE